LETEVWNEIYSEEVNAGQTNSNYDDKRVMLYYESVMQRNKERIESKKRIKRQQTEKETKHFHGNIVVDLSETVTTEKLDKPGEKTKRNTRCQVCIGCKSQRCGVCENCKDMPRFGGSNKIRHGCLGRRCRAPLLGSTDIKEHGHKVEHKCDQCVWMGSGYDLKRHIKRDHEGLRYYCDQCAFSAKALGHLGIHQQSVHEGVRYNCDQCNFKGKLKSELRQHIKVEHEGLRYYCDMCDHAAKSVPILKNHMRIQHEKRIFKCDQCLFEATTRTSVDRHKKSKHEEIRYHCDQCDLKYTEERTLTLHKQNIHEGVRYYCDICEFKASYKISLERHIKLKHKL
jgi:hypothetical protein